MKTFVVQIDEMNQIHVINEDNELMDNEQNALDYLWSRIEYNKIGRMILDQPELAEDEELIANLGTVIQYYLSEKEDFIEKNNEALLRLALFDTNEQIKQEQSEYEEADDNEISW